MRGRLTPFGVALAFCAGIVLASSQAFAGTKYQTSLVPDVAGTNPGFSAKGSSIKVDDQLRLKGKIKNVVDAAGLRVTTDGVPSLDDYSVEVDLSVPATGASGTLVVPFDLTNGNGKFSLDFSADPILAGAASGDGVRVLGVRVKDSSGTVMGGGGFAIR